MSETPETPGPAPTPQLQDPDIILSALMRDFKANELAREAVGTA